MRIVASKSKLFFIEINYVQIPIMVFICHPIHSLRVMQYPLKKSNYEFYHKYCSKIGNSSTSPASSKCATARPGMPKNQEIG